MQQQKNINVCCQMALMWNIITTLLLWQYSYDIILDSNKNMYGYHWVQYSMIWVEFYQTAINLQILFITKLIICNLNKSVNSNNIYVNFIHYDHRINKKLTLIICVKPTIEWNVRNNYQYYHNKKQTHLKNKLWRLKTI